MTSTYANRFRKSPWWRYRFRSDGAVGRKSAGSGPVGGSRRRDAGARRSWTKRPSRQRSRGETPWALAQGRRAGCGAWHPHRRDEASRSMQSLRSNVWIFQAALRRPVAHAGRWHQGLHWGGAYRMCPARGGLAENYGCKPPFATSPQGPGTPPATATAWRYVAVRSPKPTSGQQ